MLKLFRILLHNSKWLLNQKGIAPLIIAGAALTAGGLGAKMLGKSKREEPEAQWMVDPWTQKMRDVYEPRLDPSYYNIPESPVESATSTKLLQRLSRTTEDIGAKFGPEAATPYYQAEKERRKIGYGEEEAYLKDILQREGVLTSTPGLEARGKLKRQQTAETEAFGAKLMYEDVAREIEANKIAEDIVMQTLGQGTMLGGMQRTSAQWPYVMSAEALKGAQGLESIGYMPEQEEHWLEDIGGAGMDIGKLMLMMNMLGAGGGGSAGGGAAPGAGLLKSGGIAKLTP